MEIFIFLLALLFGMGAIGDRDRGNRQNFTIAFTACILAVAAIIIFK